MKNTTHRLATKCNSFLISKLLVFLVLCTYGFIVKAQPNEVVDISTSLGSSFGDVTDIYQTFQPTQDGRMVSMTYYNGSAINTQSAAAGVKTLDIYEGSGTGGTLLHSQATPSLGSNTEHTIDITVPIPLTSGQTYTFAINDVNPRLSSPGYSGGFMHGVFGSTVFTTFDAVFSITLDIGTNVAIANRGDFTNMSPMIFDVTTYGTVSGLESSDFMVINGVASNLFEESPGSWILDVTPTAEGLVTVDLAVGAATIDGLDSDAASTSSTYDITPPTNQDAIFDADDLVTAGGQVIYNDAAVTSNVFFAPVGTTDFIAGSTITQGGIVAEVDPPGCVPQAEVICGTVMQCTPQPDICTPQPDMCMMDPVTMMMVCTPQPDICTPQPDMCVTVPDPACTPMAAVICGSVDVPVINAPTTLGEYKLFITDAAGNISAPSSATLIVTNETHATTSVITVSDDQLLAGETAEVTFLFLDAVTDFTNDDLSVESGTLSTVSSTDGNISFNATFTPNADVDNTGFAIVIVNSQITDGSTAGSGFALSNEYGVHTLSPAISSIVRQVPTDASTSADEVTFRVTFNVAVESTSVETSDFALSGTAASDGSLGAPVMIDSKTYDFPVTGLTNSNGTIGLDYTGTIYYLEASNTITGGDPAGEESYTLLNNILSFETTAITSIDQNTEYTYPIEVASSFGGAGLSVSATNLPDWLTISSADTITSFLGNSSSRGDTGDGGPVSSATFQKIQDQAYDSQGNLYLVDQSNHRVRVIGTDGDINAFAGTGTFGFSGDGGLAVSAELGNPSAITIDDGDNIYILDKSNARIRKVDAITKVITTVAGTGTSGFSGDGGLATSADISGSSVDIAVSSTGDILLLEGTRIRKVDASGIISTIAGTNLVSTFVEGALAVNSSLTGSGIALDASDNIFITTQQHAIRRIDATTNIITTVGGTGTEGFFGDGGLATAAQFSFGVLSGIELDAQGNIFVADNGNRRIRVITPDGMVRTIAGNGNVGSSGDGGAALDASLFLSSHISLGLEGNILLAESRQLRSVQTNRALLSGIPSNSDVGMNQIDLTVSNGIISTDQQFDITVANVNDEPFFGNTSFTATQDTYFEAMINTTDVDGDFVEFIVPSPPSWLQSKDTLESFTFASSGNFTDIVWDGENYLMPNATLHSIQSVDILGSNLTLVAGSGTTATGTSDGVGTAASFNMPLSMDINSTGVVYITDMQNGLLRQMNKNEGIYSVKTFPITTLVTPMDVLVAPNDDIYISDAGTGTIRKISNGAQTTLQDGSNNDITFTTPYGLAMDDDGDLYVADNGAHAIYKISGTTKTLVAGTEGLLGFTDGLATTAQFDEPTGIWVNGDGTVILVSDNGNDAIRKISFQEPAIVTTLDASQSTPLGLTVDPNTGSLLIANFDFGSILKSVPSVKLSGTPSSTDVGNVEFDVIASDGELQNTQSASIFVANVNDAPVFTGTMPTSEVEDAVFSYALSATDIDNDALSYSVVDIPSWMSLQQAEPIVSTYAGNGNNDFVASGTLPTELGIGTVDAIAVSDDGVVYIGTDNRILKVTNNTISIIAGDGNGQTTGDGGSASAAQINGVDDLHVSPDGTIYFSTYGGTISEGYPTIRKIDTDGIITTVAGAYSATFESSGDGGLATNASISGLRGIFVDSEGNIYAADGNANSIRKIDTDGMISTVATNVSNAFDMIVTSTGSIYAVTDGSTGLLRIDDQDNQAEVVTDFSATRIDMDNLGNLYGITRGTPHLLKFNIASGATSADVVANVAGTTGFSGDEGAASAATFDQPAGIAVGFSGDVFIADNGNSRVRKLTIQPYTLSGTPTQSDLGDLNVIVRVSDGLLNTDQTFTLSVNNLPEIINVTGTDGRYGIGDEVTINIQFDGDVTLTGAGTPTITLETGDTDQVGVMTSSSSDALSFTYTVQEGDKTDELTLSLLTIDLDGNTLTSAEGVAAVLDIPANYATGSLEANNDINIDGNKPVLSEEFTSNNDNETRAKVGDEVTLELTATEELSALPSVTIAGKAVTATLSSFNKYEAVYTMTEDDVEGSVPFTVDFSDLAGNAGTQITGSDFEVYFDKTVPTLTSVVITSSNTDNTTAKDGDMITLAFTSSEPLIASGSNGGSNENIDVTINGTVATVSATGNTTDTFEAKYQVASDDEDGEINFEISFSDPTGNMGTPVTNVTTGNLVTIDQTSPTPTITSTSDAYNTSFDINIDFDEAVSGFDMDDLSLVNATVSSLIGSSASYVARVDPLSEGEVSVSVLGSDVLQTYMVDATGNGNRASNTLNVTYDFTAPTVSLSLTDNVGFGFGSGAMGLAFSQSDFLVVGSSTKRNGPFTVYIALSEEVANFNINNLTLTNATATDFTGSGLSYQVTVNPMAEGSLTVSVVSESFADAAGNANIASNTINVEYDATSPAVELSTASASLTNTFFDVNITFNEEVSGFTIDDLTLVNATASDFSGSGSTYVVQINPSEDGEVSISIASDVASDNAGNANTASNTVSVDYDATSPTVTLATTTADPTNTFFDVNITFSEEVAGFTVDDLTLTNATASDFSGSGSSYVVQINPTADGEVTVAIASEVSLDAAGNGNDASSTLSIDYDATSPIVELTTESASLTNDVFDVNIIFSEAVTGFITASDITVTNATTFDFFGSGSEYFVSINPTGDGEVTVAINAEVALDAAGNGNDASNIISVEFDSTNPIVELTTESASLTNDVIDVNIIFSEDVTGFSVDDITLTNATASDFSGSGSNYTATITPTLDGTVSVEISENIASDNAENGNEASGTLSIDYDATNPAVVLSTASESLTNAVFDVNITFSEEVAGFTVDDLTLTNATASDFSGSGSSYVVQINPTSDGEVTIEVVSEVAQDAAGNGNDASSTLSVDYDATNPTVVLSTASESLTNAVFDVNITFSEEVAGFTVDDLTLTNATASDFSGSGSSYVVQINPTSDGEVTIEVVSEVAQDAAGNGNDVSNTISIDYDSTNPTVVVSRNGTDPVEGDFEISIEFSEDVFGFESADVLVANGTLSSLSGTGSSYTCTITPLESLITIDIEQGIAQDLAGNDNTAAETLSVEFSTSKQTQVITVVPIDDQTYGNEPFDLIASTDSNLELSFETNGPILLADGKVTITGTGTASVVVSQSGNDDFQSASTEITFEISKANLSIVAEDQTKVYAQEIPALTYEISGFVYNEDISVMSMLPSLETGAEQLSDVGEYVIVASGASADNYTFSYTDGKLSITQATQEITVEAVSDKLVTAEPFDLGATTNSDLILTYSVVGPASIEAGIVTLTGVSGTVEININQEGNLNYLAATTATVSFQVTDPAKTDQQITFAGIDEKVYGDMFALEASSTSALAVTYSISSGNATIEANILTVRGIDPITVVASQSGSDLFNPAESVAQTFSVSQATLVVAAEDKTKVYDEALPELTYTVSGFVLDETETVFTESPTVSTEANSGSDVGQYPIIVSGGVATNYTIQLTNGQLTITKAIATIEVTDLTQDADGTAKQPIIVTSPSDLNYTVLYDGSSDLPVSAGEYETVVTIDELNYEGTTTVTFLLKQPPLNVEPTLELSTYPNPAIDHFRLESNKQLTLVVYDGNGVLLIKSLTNTRVDIKHLSEGMYFIKVQDEHNRTIGMQKLIKK